MERQREEERHARVVTVSQRKVVGARLILGISRVNFVAGFLNCYFTPATVCCLIRRPNLVLECSKRSYTLW